MKKTEKQRGADQAPRPEPERPQPRVRLPGFLTDEEVGLGDVIKRATSYVGLPACGGCERRAAALNRWVAFGKRKS